MFCSNCGKEVSGKFCAYCGNKLEVIEESNPIVETSIGEAVITEHYTIINGIQVDMEKIVNKYGKEKISAINYICTLTGVGIKEGKRIVDDAYAELYNPEPKKGFFEKVKEERQAQAQKELENMNKEQERIRKAEEEGIAYCPKCHSTSLSANKKGFGIGKAIFGAALTGGIGLVAGNIGAKDVRVTCLKCGHQFWAGKK